MRLALAALLLSCAPNANTSTATTSTASPTTNPPPPSGWRLAPGEKILGSNHAHIHRRGHGYGSASSAQQLDVLRGLGANFIAVTSFAFQPTSTSDSLVGYGPDAFTGTQFPKGAPKGKELHDSSMTDGDLKAEVEHAHARGLRVAFKPHLWAGDFGSGQWHGTVHQSSDVGHAHWWQSYRAYILSEGRRAAACSADMIVIGTELVQMTTSTDATTQQRQDAEWRSLINDVRAVFGGSVTYAAHWSDEAFALTFWDALDLVGVSAYFPLDAPLHTDGDDASVDELAAAWAPHTAKLAALAAAHPQQPLVFLELGFRAVRGNHRTPWSTDNRGAVRDDDEQARAYAATARVLQQAPWWRGALLWKTFTDPALADEEGDGTSYSFTDRKAATVIKTWFNP